MALPIEAEARGELWRLGLAQIDPEAAGPLLVALARHCGQAALAASRTGQWALSQSQLDEAREYYGRLRHGPRELAGLLVQLVVDLHQAVFADQPPEPAERGALCYRAYGLLQDHRGLAEALPEWMESLEEQLVREGGLVLRELSQQDQGDVLQRRQALELLLHLGRLHQPVPEWIVLAQRELLEPEVALLPEPEAIERLLAWLPGLALEAEAQAGVELACLRARAALELLEHQHKPRPAQIQSPPPVEPPPVASASFQNCSDLLRYLQLESANWMRSHGGGEGPVELALVLKPGEPAVQQQAQRLSLNLAPLMAFAAVEQLDQLLPAFFEPLGAEHSARFRLQEPNSAVSEALSAVWSAGGQLAPRVFPGLVYAAELWSRCGGEQGLGAALQPWSLPVAELRPGGTLLRPGNVELAALQSVLFQGDRLEEALVEIRRHHHDRTWMEQRSERWWMDPSDPLENLRRLHTNAGFYASSHAPMESLQRWSQASLAALLSGPVLFGNDSITRMLWPVAQQLQQQNGRVLPLVQWPGPQAFYNFIAGQEVLMVTPLAAELEAHHRSGRAFELFTSLTIRPYGLRAITAPMSVYPNRPASGFEDSLQRCLDQIERAYQQKPFAVFTAAAGAYGLPLCEAVHRRFGVACVYIGNQMHAYFGLEQATTADWLLEQRRPENWLMAQGLNGIAGVDRIEGGRYLSR